MVVFTSFCLPGQADYKQNETIGFKVKMGHQQDFEKTLAVHKEKYHSIAPFKIGIFEVQTGPNSGAYELAMGPMTFTQMEFLPALSSDF